MVRKDRASQEDPDGGRATTCVETRRSCPEARGRDPREYRTCIESASSAWMSQRGIGRASVLPVSLVYLFRVSVGIIDRCRLRRSCSAVTQTSALAVGSVGSRCRVRQHGSDPRPQSGFKRCSLSRSHPLDKGRV
jgi:hypothetical protein